MENVLAIFCYCFLLKKNQYLEISVGQFRENGIVSCFVVKTISQHQLVHGRVAL